MALRLSLVGFLSKWTNERIELVFGTGASFDLFYTVFVRKLGGTPCRNKGTSLWNFVPNSGLRNFATASRSCYQQNSSTVKTVDHTCDGRRVTAAGRTYVYYTSVDRNTLTPLLRFIVDLLYNLFQDLCSSRHDFDRHSASRGPSAIAELLVRRCTYLLS